MGLIRAICQAQEIEYTDTVICPNCGNRTLKLNEKAICSHCNSKWQLIELHDIVVKEFEDRHSVYIKMMTER